MTNKQTHVFDNTWYLYSFKTSESENRLLPVLPAKVFR